MISVQTYRFGAAPGVPNNPDLPAVVAPSAFPAEADAVAARLESVGWGGLWVWSVFDWHHYHPDGHEALVVISGGADLILGGPEGADVSVVAGDALILPAGTGHCLIRARDGFSVCGAYPGGGGVETLAARDGIPEGTRERIAAVPRPATDPLQGGLYDAWAL